MTHDEKRLIKRWDAEGYAYRFCSICGRVWQVSKGMIGRYTCPTCERKEKK